MRVCHGRKIKIVLIKKRLWLITLLILAGLLYAQQARALPPRQRNPEINNRTLPKRIWNNPNARSYLSFNPFTLSKSRPSVSPPRSSPNRQPPILLEPIDPELSNPIIIKRPPVRVPIRPPLRSPYIAL